MTSTVPIGKGLSSSASLEVAVARALNRAFELELTDLDIALLCHRAETGFVGAPVGIMDHMVCSLGDREHALFLDAAHECSASRSDYLRTSSSASSTPGSRIRTRAVIPVRVVGNATRRPAVLAFDGCATITPERSAAGRRSCLSRSTAARVTSSRRICACWLLFRRSRRADADALGALFLESHASMRDDFEVSTPEIDASSTSPRAIPMYSAPD